MAEPYLLHAPGKPRSSDPNRLVIISVYEPVSTHNS